MRILFVSAGSQATVYAVASLATAARNGGHQVLMTANDDMVPAIVDTGLPAVSVTSRQLKDFVTRDRSGNPVEVPKDPAGQMLFTGRWFGRLAAASLGALRDLARDWRPDLVVGGAMSYAAPLLAHELQVPCVRHAVDTTETTGIDPGAEDELRPELAGLGLDRLPDPDLFIDICPPSLRPPDAGPAQMMRWIPGNRQRRLEPWMYTRGERRRVCVTFGSRVALTHSVDALGELARELRSQDAEVVVAAPDDVAEELRAGLGDVRAGWVPLDVVAPTCDLLVHHGGGVTSMTAMVAGVPQLLLPKVPYAAIPARRLADHGAAVALPPDEATPEGVATGCRELLSDPSYRLRARALAREIAALPPPSDVVNILEKLEKESHE